jgi:hypothetical protein
MYESVTVDDAIKKGHRMINYPSLFIFIGVMGLCFYLSTVKIFPAWIVPMGLLIGLILAWVYWSFRITKWKLWAFENVRNVHELKKRAIQEKLIWQDGSIFGKTEIWTAEDKEKWALVSLKFDKADIFQEDLTVEEETIIYVAKKNLMISAGLLFLCAGVGIYLAATKSPIWGLIMTGVCVYLAYLDFKKANNEEPQIVLNNKGIKTTSTEFQNWANITGEEVISEGSGKHIHHYLIYNHPDGEEKLDIKDLDTDIKALNKLLILYRGRSNQRKTSYFG